MSEETTSRRTRASKRVTCVLVLRLSDHRRTSKTVSIFSKCNYAKKKFHCPVIPSQNTGDSVAYLRHQFKNKYPVITVVDGVNGDGFGGMHDWIPTHIFQTEADGFI